MEIAITKPGSGNADRVFVFWGHQTVQTLLIPQSFFWEQLSSIWRKP
jgi:hypothetical protein